MFTVSVEITRYVDDSQPGWIECKLRDVSGREWFFVDKVPVITDALLNANSIYPQPASINCNIVARRVLADGREVATIDTEYPWHINATTGETRFDVWPEQVFELPPRKLPDINCVKHGKHRMALLCCHLAHESGSGFVTSPLPPDSWYGPDERWAWCTECEKLRIEQNGWSEEMGNFVSMHIVCALCYEEARSRNIA